MSKVAWETDVLFGEVAVNFERSAQVAITDLGTRVKNATGRDIDHTYILLLIENIHGQILVKIRHAERR